MTQQDALSPIGHFRSLLESGALPQVLESMPDQDFSLIYMVDGSQREFSSFQAGDFSATDRVEIGCIAKNLTSLLIAMGVSEGLVRLDDDVGKYFPRISAGNSLLKVFHLLNHTHGLDASALQRIPYNEDGYIDSDRVWRTVSSAPLLHAPGELFHYYGHAGMWLAAAILEQVHKCKFSELLQDRILRPLGIACDAANMQTICPAAGGMELCARELMRLCSFHLGDHGNSLTAAIGDMRARFPFQLPHWPPIADFAGLGWFGFRGNSCGMYGQRMGASALILVSPDEHAALTLTARSDGAISAARKKLLGKLVSDGQAGPPRLLSKRDRQALPIAAIVGRYASAEIALDITFTHRGDLLAEMSQRNPAEAAETHIVTLLLPASDYVFFPVRPERTMLPFVRLVGDLGGVFTNAIIGKRVLRRVSAADPLRRDGDTYSQVLPDRE